MHEVFDKPFPHFLADDLFDLETLRAGVEDWPSDSPHWKRYGNNKRALSDFDLIPPKLQAIIHRGQNETRRMVQERLGTPPLLHDPSLYGAGLHETLKGGRLGMHVDFNLHPTTGLYRRVNAILFLNENCILDRGGWLNLEFDDIVMIRPQIGTFIAWETADDRWHGHPVPLKAESRKSIAWYFYTVEKPEGFTKPHGTIYRDKA